MTLEERIKEIEDMYEHPAKEYGAYEDVFALCAALRIAVEMVKDSNDYDWEDIEEITRALGGEKK